MMVIKQRNMVMVCNFIWILFVVTFAGNLEADICEKVDECSCKKSNGKTINLRFIDGTTARHNATAIAYRSIPLVNAGGRWPFVYDWNPCTKFSEGQNCKDMLMCERYAAVADLTNPCATDVSHFAIQSDGSTVITYMPVTDSTPKKRIVHITLKCDETVFPGNISGIDGDWKDTDGLPTVVYNATFTSRCACDDGCVVVPYPVPGTFQGTKLGTGSYLLIGFFALIFVYLIGGTAINVYRKGLEGNKAELLPNYDFWSRMPTLVKMGVVYSCGSFNAVCCSICRRCTSDGYASINS